MMHAIEPTRLMRGARLPVRKLGHRQYLVAGSREPWAVDLDTDPPCNCPDLYYRGRRFFCKHVCAALLQTREPSYVYALALVLEQRASALEDAA